MRPRRPIQVRPGRIAWCLLLLALGCYGRVGFHEREGHIGEPCFDNSDCVDVCIDDTCASLSDSGGPCDDATDCFAGLACGGSICSPGGAGSVNYLVYREPYAVYVYNDLDAASTKEIVPNIPTMNGTALSFEIAPDLIARTGLSFGATTGVISGKPTRASAATDYTVTAFNGSGRATTTVTIRTAPGFTVDSTGDLGDASPTDSQCRTVNGECSLRAALEQNGATAGGAPRVIIVPPSTIGIGASVRVTAGAEIIGAGMDVTILDGGAGAYDLLVVSGATTDFTISGLTVRNLSGCAINIAAAAPATLESIRVTGVAAPGAPNAAVYVVDGALTVVDSVFVENEDAANGSTPLVCDGTATCVVGNTRFTLNAGSGAMVCGELTTCSVSGSQFSENTGFDRILFGNGQLNVDGCEFSGNRTIQGDSTIIEGIVYVFGSGNSATISNSTFVDNILGYNGAAVTSTTVWNDDIGPTTNLVSLTIVNNTRTGTSSYGNAAGIWKYRKGSLSLTNSIVAGNVNTASGTTENCTEQETTAIASGGYNLSDSAAAECSMNEPTDIVGMTANLLALADNGGPTRTMAPAAGSMAIQHGPPVEVCESVLGSSIDQRGDPRPGGASKTNCDIGAYESP